MSTKPPSHGDAGKKKATLTLAQVRMVIAFPRHEDLASEGRLLVVEEGPEPDVPIIFTVVAR